MEFNLFELDIIIAGVREGRNSSEKRFVESLKKDISKSPYSDNKKNDFAEDLFVLQRYNNLLIKLEEEYEKISSTKRF